MITILLLFGVALLLSLFAYKVREAQKVWEKKGVLQRPQKFLLGDFGEMVFQTSSIPDLFHKVYHSFPDARYLGAYSFTFPSLLIRDPELIKLITVKDFDHFMDHKPFIPPEVDPYWGKNLLTLSGNKWKDMRATLSPAFTASKMKKLLVLMEECAQNFVVCLEKNPDEGRVVEAKELFGRFANDVIATCAFGINCDSLKNKNNEFYRMGRILANFGFLRSLVIMAYFAIPKITAFFRIKLIPEYLTKILRTIVIDNIKEREEKSIKRPDMINILMEAKRGRLIHEEDESNDANFSVVYEAQTTKQHKEKAPITDDDIAAQAIIFFLAGFETVSTVMSFMCYELMVNPDVQKKLQLEIDGFMKLNQNKVTYEMLSQMKYLDMVISETLRKWPPTIALDRVCTKPYIIQPTKIGEKPLQLNVNDFISIPNMSIQRDPKYYPEPDRFDPERFNDENKVKIDPYTYTPFGIGPRGCIGSRFALQEIKTIFTLLLSKFDIVPNEKSQIPLKLSKAGTLKSERGTWITLKSRTLK